MAQCRPCLPPVPLQSTCWEMKWVGAPGVGQHVGLQHLVHMQRGQGGVCITRLHCDARSSARSQQCTLQGAAAMCGAANPGQERAAGVEAAAVRWPMGVGSIARGRTRTRMGVVRGSTAQCRGPDMERRRQHLPALTVHTVLMPSCSACCPAPSGGGLHGCAVSRRGRGAAAAPPPRAPRIGSAS